MSRVYFPEARVVVRAIVENFSESNRPIDFPVIPKSLQIVRNSYKQPDSWNVEFDAKDFPIPPSLLRAAQVSIYLYNNQGLTINRTIATQDTPAIVGLIDSVETEFSSDGRSVRFEGQDYTALFTEHKFNRRRNLTNLRLDQAIDSLRKEVDITNQMRLVTEIPFPVSQLPVIGRSVSRTNRRGFPIKPGDNYWNVMYDLALKHGFILFVRDLDLVLATPNSIIEESTRDTSRTFRLSWGKNIEQISVSRQMGKERVPQIEVISYDEKDRKPIVGRFPERRQKVTMGVGTKRNEVIVSVLRGITDEAILRRLAEVQYTLLARTEQTVEFSTRELVDEGDADLLFLRTGDSFFVAFDPFNAEELRRQPAAQRAQWLVDRGFTPQAANVFANHFEQLNTFKRPFYVREANIEWSHDSGLTLSANVANFVNVEGTQESGEVSGGVAENV